MKIMSNLREEIIKHMAGTTPGLFFATENPNFTQIVVG